jgi:hypothetical protein
MSMALQARVIVLEQQVRDLSARFDAMNKAER